MNDQPPRGLPHITDLLLAAALVGKFTESDQLALRKEFNYEFSDGTLYFNGVQGLTACIHSANSALAKARSGNRIVLSDFENSKRGTGYGEIIFFKVQLDIVDGMMNVLSTTKIADTTDRYSP